MTLLLLLLLACAERPGGPPTVNGDPDHDWPALPALDQSIVEIMGRDSVPGLSACLVVEGEVTWCNGYGERNTDTGDLAYAFALIELEGKPGDQMGWFGFGPVEGSENVKKLTVTGYPFADVPKNTLWEATCAIDSNEQNAYFYRCPGKGTTIATMLGSPFFIKGPKEGDAGQLLGIHTGP